MSPEPHGSTAYLMNSPQMKFLSRESISNMDDEVVTSTDKGRNRNIEIHRSRSSIMPTSKTVSRLDQRSRNEKLY